MASRVVITDAYSSLGKALLRAFEHTHFSLMVPRHNMVDWCDEDQVHEYMDANAPQVILNTVGWGEFLDLEGQNRLTKAAENIAKVSQEYSCIVIHISSFRVFGGENKSYYDEDDRPSPIDATGRAYWDAERAFEFNASRYLCIRLGWVLDIHSDTLFRRLMQNLIEQEPCDITDQRIGTPIGFAAFAKVVLSLVNQTLCGAENWGILHYASGDSCTYEELAEAVMNHLRDDHDFSRKHWFSEIPEDQKDHPLLMEPVSSALSMRRCRDDFGVQHKSWRQGLGLLVSQYLELSVAEQQKETAGS